MQKSLLLCSVCLHQWRLPPFALKYPCNIPLPRHWSGRPLPPLLFSVCASFVLFCFDPISSAHPYMYVDDLCILITSKFSDTIQQVIQCLHEFGQVSGLQLNLGKSAVVVKGNLSTKDIKAVKDRHFNWAIH